MATRSVQVSDAWELMSLLGNKAGNIVSHLGNVRHPVEVRIEEIGQAIARMNELHLALKEAIVPILAALERQAKEQAALEAKSARRN
jgi:hypothetical protein